MNTPQLEDLLTVNEVAESLRVSRHTIFSLIKEGKLPALRVGRQFRITKADLMKAIGNTPQTTEENAE